MRSLEHLVTIARKEIGEIITNRGLLFSGIFFAAWFSIMTGMGLIGEEETLYKQFSNSLFYMSSMIGLFIGYVYSGQTFLREKQTGIVETLLCAPVSLRTIWLGKALGVAFPSWVLAVIAAGVITVMTNHSSPETLAPGAPVIVHLLVALPLFITAAVALIGFGQLMLGMRENMLVNMLTIMVLFGALAATRIVLESNLLVTWAAVAALGAASAILLAVTTLLGRFLSRERIVRTIP